LAFYIVYNVGLEIKLKSTRWFNLFDSERFSYWIVWFIFKRFNIL